MTANPRAAVIQYLLAQTAITDLCGLRIYPELPDSDSAPSIPESLVVAESGGSQGSGGGSYSKWYPVRLEIWAYGPTPGKASDLFNLVRQTLKGMRRNVTADTLLQSASASSGAVSGRDPKTNWPFTWGSFDVSTAEDYS